MWCLRTSCLLTALGGSDYRPNTEINFLYITFLNFEKRIPLNYLVVSSLKQLYGALSLFISVYCALKYILGLFL